MRTTPLRSEKYLRFIRSQPCWVCATTEGIHAHHHGRSAGGGGTGLKTCDLHTVPLCHQCHGEFHRTGKIGMASRDQTMGELWKAVAILLRRAFIEGVLEHVDRELTG